MKKLLRISMAAELLGVCTKTIRRWHIAGKIECKLTIGGHRRISIFEIERIPGGNKNNAGSAGGVAIYSRVSSHEQKKKGDLERQVGAAKSFYEERGEQHVRVFTDVASGLNARRRGLSSLCSLVGKGEVSKVVLTYRDRLTRFGFEYLERYFQSHGTEIEVLDEKATGSPEEELVQDLVAIVTSFPGRVHGLRSHRNKKAHEIGNRT